MRKSKTSLRKFLFDKRIELYEAINTLCEEQKIREITDDEKILLEIYYAELNLIKSVIEICTNRNKF